MKELLSNIGAGGGAPATGAAAPAAGGAPAAEEAKEEEKEEEKEESDEDMVRLFACSVGGLGADGVGCFYRASVSSTDFLRLSLSSFPFIPRFCIFRQRHPNLCTCCIPYLHS